MKRKRSKLAKELAKPSSLAQEIAKQLFLNGVGEIADRIVLVHEDHRRHPPFTDLGGWTQAAAAAWIQKVIDAWPSKLSRYLQKGRKR